jgi:hypothetical protein
LLLLVLLVVVLLLLVVAVVAARLAQECGSCLGTALHPAWSGQLRMLA